MSRPKGLVYGWGVNDAEYDINPTVNGKQKQCPYHSRWKEMIRRAHSKEMKVKRPTVSSSVCSEWKYFMNFKAWMEQQNWEGLQLDKDILVIGNREYSPDKCCFVPSKMNSLMSKVESSRGDYPLGVYFANDRYLAQVQSLGKGLYLGSHESSELAHRAWKIGKIEQIEDRMKWYRNQDCYLKKVDDAFFRRICIIRESIELSTEISEI